MQPMMMELSEKRIDQIKKYLWERFSIKTENIDIYDEAFTHSTCGPHNNQRLAFLGDRVFDLILAEFLLHKYPDYGKGPLDGQAHLERRYRFSQPD